MSTDLTTYDIIGCSGTRLDQSRARGIGDARTAVFVAADAASIGLAFDELEWQRLRRVVAQRILDAGTMPGLVDGDPDRVEAYRAELKRIARG